MLNLIEIGETPEYEVFQETLTVVAPLDLPPGNIGNAFVDIALTGYRHFENSTSFTTKILKIGKTADMAAAIRSSLQSAVK